MSTRSRIAIQKKGGEVVSIYCHFDGYIEGVGNTLRKHYNTKEKALELIKKGDISVLNNSIETTKYYKDRGDDWHTIEPILNRKLFGLMLDLQSQFMIEYVYLFSNGEWSVSELKEYEQEDSYLEFTAYHTKFKPLLSYFKQKEVK